MNGDNFAAKELFQIQVVERLCNGAANLLLLSNRNRAHMISFNARTYHAFARCLLSNSHYRLCFRIVPRGFLGKAVATPLSALMSRGRWAGATRRISSINSRTQDSSAN